jgi:hypothetical protein
MDRGSIYNCQFGDLNMQIWVSIGNARVFKVLDITPGGQKERTNDKTIAHPVGHFGNSYFWLP